MAIDSLTRTQVYQQNPVTNRVVAVVVVAPAQGYQRDCFKCSSRLESKRGMADMNNRPTTVDKQALVAMVEGIVDKFYAKLGGRENGKIEKSSDS